MAGVDFRKLTTQPLLALLPTEDFDVLDSGASQWRTITGFVDRMLPAAMLADERGSRPVIQIEVENDGVIGVAATFDRANTLFAIPLRDGGTVDHSVTMKCSKILNQDEGMVKLELR
jgi:hypothetical protein